MTSTEKSKIRRSKLRELEAIAPNHSRVIKEKNRLRGNWIRRRYRLNQLRKEDYNHPRLVKLRETDARNARDCRSRNPQSHKDSARRHYIKNKEAIKATSEKRRVAMQELEKIDPLNPRVLKFRKALRTGQAKNRAKNKSIGKKPNYSPEARERMRIRRNIGCRILGELRKARAGKSAGTVKLLGCSIESFMRYIETKFEVGMSWDNYNHETWHLDHIIPCATFDLSISEHQSYCFHFSNYQPMWAVPNMQKHAKLPLNFNLTQFLSTPLPEATQPNKAVKSAQLGMAQVTPSQT